MMGRRRTDGRPYQRLAGRVAFAGSLLVFLIIGIVLVGNFSAQWWILLVPIGLLVGPVMAARREVRRSPDGRPETMPWS